MIANARLVVMTACGALGPGLRRDDDHSVVVLEERA